MKLFFAMLPELPVVDEAGATYVQAAALPNGIPIMMIHPDNLEELMGLARKFSALHKSHVDLIAIDLHELFSSNFVSPSAVPGLPEWVSIN